LGNKVKTPDELKAEILRLTREYSRRIHRAQQPAGETAVKFVPGETIVPYAGRVFDEAEVEAGVASMLDFWLTLGKEGEEFERQLAQFLGVKKSILVNSGSSANLVAFSALTSPKLPEDSRIRPGDEVITCAAAFPTTVAPIVQNGAVPVFLDNDPITGNIDARSLEQAYVDGKTKAVMCAHTLGNPFDLNAVLGFCDRHDLWLIEDNCDALGSTYTRQLPDRKSETRLTGSWGDLSTQSFYPPHHLTLGEGGAINIIKQMQMKVLLESFRDWGRDCWCASGKANTCNKRFDWQLGDLPHGYDHKYTYSHIGYNLKPLDPQAAIGIKQLAKLPHFIEARKRNWQYLRSGLNEFEEFFEFSLPTHAKRWNHQGFEWDESGCQTDPSWFGFMLLARATAPFTRTELARGLDDARIGNRMLFGGNLVRQPAFVQLKKDRPNSFRVLGDLAGADRIMKEAIFIGVYPGLSQEMLDYMIDTIRKLVRAK
jgi:CDP-6-deoxy-D-xylo-4-hexulose-3-dehydrase